MHGATLRALSSTQDASLIRGASPLGLPYTRSRAPLASAPLAVLARILGMTVGFMSQLNTVRTVPSRLRDKPAMKHLLSLGVCLLALGPASLAAQTAVSGVRNLTVVSAGPTGEVASLAEANEIRIVFSEPMVDAWPHPRCCPGAVRQDHAGHRGRVPLVRHDDPDLHSCRETAAALRDALRRHRRCRPRPRSAGGRWANPTASASRRRRRSCFAPKPIGAAAAPTHRSSSCCGSTSRSVRPTSPRS